MGDKRVLIVGGGIIGLSTAWYLARRGVEVTVVDGGRPAASASAGNAGLFAPGHPPLPRPGLARLALRWLGDADAPLYIPPRPDLGLARWLWSFHRACREERVAECMGVLGPLGHLTLACWQEMLGAFGSDCFWHGNGLLLVYGAQDGRRLAEQEARLARQQGFAAEALDGAALRRREPAFTAAARGAVAFAEGTGLDPGRFLADLAADLRRSGVSIREDTPVGRLTLAEGRVRGAALADGEQIAADETVLAAGAWSARLAATVGIRLPLAAGKGYHLDLATPAPPLRTGCVLVDASVAVTPLGPRLRLAGTLEFSGINLRLRERRVAMLRRAAGAYLEGVADAAEHERWCGLRPCLADGLPVVGRAPGLDGLYVATGHAKMGLTLGPATGRLVAESLVDGRPSLDLSLLRVDRF